MCATNIIFSLVAGHQTWYWH